MHDLSSRVSSNALIRSIESILPPDTFLVGGCIRDMLLGREPLDFDLIVSGRIEEIARRISSKLGSKAFWMDEKRGVMRIVAKPSGESIDLSMLKGEGIGIDLMSRDLTINAMAFGMSSGEFLDPASGLTDLHNGIIRLISEENLVSDPVRGLRALRFSVTLDFALHEETSRLIRRHRALVGRAAPERIRQELVKALNVHHGSKFFRLLLWSGLVPVLFPANLTGEMDELPLDRPIFRKAIPLCMEMDAFLHGAEALMPGSGDSLSQETESEVKRSALLRLSTFLMGLREEWLEKKPEKRHERFADMAAEFCSSLHFSTLSCRMVRGSLANQELAGAVLSKPDASPLDLHRLCEEAAPFMPEALLLSMTIGQLHGVVQRQAASHAWDYFSNVYLEHKKHPLVTGTDIVNALGGVSGPRVGAFQRKIEEARAEGIVHTRKEALDYLLVLVSALEP